MGRALACHHVHSARVRGAGGPPHGAVGRVAGHVPAAGHVVVPVPLPALVSVVVPEGVSVVGPVAVSVGGPACSALPLVHPGPSVV